MILSDTSVKRPVFAAVLSMLLILAGAVSFTQLSVRDLPAIEPPIVSISVTYVGANAQVIENRITQVLEDRVAGIEGIDNISSTSQDGRSNITIEFSAARDLDAAANDVRDRVSGSLSLLPQEADPPEIRKVDVDAQPILWMNVTHPRWSPMQLTQYAETVLQDRFESIDGVSRVRISGEAKPSMRVWLSQQALIAYGMTTSDIEQALRRQNVELPAGRIEGPGTNLTVRVNRQFSTPADFERLVVGRARDGYLVRLGDVARIAVEPENRYNSYHSNGEPAIGIGIVRQSGANTLQVARDTKAAMEAARQTLPEGMQIAVSFDSSLFIERAIGSVWHTLGEAAVLVVIVIFIFLGSFRATLIPALTVPICLTATFAVLFALGYSLNMLTLLAFVLAIGIVVDDAIVVLENIHYRIEQGEPLLAAAYNGARQVAFAVVATTVVVCAVFLPLYFIAGRTGMLFRELAGAMIGAVAFSGFVALSLTPMLCSKLLQRETSRNRLSAAFDRGFARIQNGYARSLRRVIHRPLLVGGGAILFIAFALLLGSRLQSELAPAEDMGYFSASLQAAEGTSYQRMVSYVDDLEQKILPMVGDGHPVQRILARVPGSFTAAEDFSTGNIMAVLAPWEQRDVTTADVMGDFQTIINADPRIRDNVSAGNTLSRGGRPLQLVISGNSFDELAAARDAIFREAAQNPDIIDLDSDYRETKPQLVVDIDTTRAGDLGVPIADIGATLETMMGSRRVTTYLDKGEEYYVILQAEDADRATPDNLANIYVRSTVSQELIPLSNLVSLREMAQAGSLSRFNKQRSITLQGNLARGVPLGQGLDYLEAIALQQPQVTAIGYKGESKQLRQTGSSLWIVLALTVVLVFLVLAAQFESFVHPAVIILTVPLALGGGLIGLFVMGGTLNIYSQVGIVMLVGLAAKNGILIVEFANQLRDHGHSFDDAILEAAIRRLRPVLMTSVATVAGATPLMLASGAGAGSRQAIGVVVVWGVSLATLLTLFVIPTLYAALARRTRSPLTISRQLTAELDSLGDTDGQTAE